VIRLDEAEVARRLGALDLVGLMRETLLAAAQGEGAGPVRAALTTPPGVWFAAMPAWSGGAQPALGAKLVVAVPANASRGLPTHRAVVILFDPRSGEPVAWVEAEELTRARTAAVSVVATQALARTPRGPHAILGAGAQGCAHLEAFARAGLVERLAVWSRDRAHAEELARATRALGIEARAAGDADEAVRGASVVTTCTASAQPLFDAASAADGAHVNAVGACVATKRELPPRLVGEASLVVDDLDAARAEAGDVILAVADGAARWDGAVSLGDVLARRARPRDGRVSVFESLGLGVEDVAAAAALVRTARASRPSLGSGAIVT
jgi:alanine dehydrogenase